MSTCEPEWGPRGLLKARLGSLAFLAFLALPILALVGSQPPAWRLVAGVLGIGAFVACYTRVVWLAVPRLQQNPAPYSLVAAIVIGLAMLAVVGFNWLIALAFYFNGMLLVSLSRRWALWCVLGVTGGFVVGGFAAGDDAGTVLGVGASILSVGLLQAAFFRQIDDARQLREARAELARLAVAEERVRIARDLHDLLGQRLAAVALKSELAVRLLRADDADRAEVEMTEVSKVAREALDEVRATLSGYRDVSLATEVHTAVALLGAAGVDTTPSPVPVGLPPAVDDVASWVVREATTNVVRHAHADRCRITLARVAGALEVEVADDGVGVDSTGVVRGNGLSGLAERVAAAGGDLTVGPVDGWFAVRVRIPT
jgi:two-component system sensor histidine kinase DesK